MGEFLTQISLTGSPQAGMDHYEQDTQRAHNAGDEKYDKGAHAMRPLGRRRYRIQYSMRADARSSDGVGWKGCSLSDSARARLSLAVRIRITSSSILTETSLSDGATEALMPHRLDVRALRTSACYDNQKAK